MKTDFDLPVHLIRFECQAQTPVHFGAQAGSQIRGGLWEALRTFACTDSGQTGQPEHSLHCPLCFMLAMESDSARGMNPARPLVIRPPLPVRAGEDVRVSSGEQLTLEFVLTGRAAALFPYLVQAVRLMGQSGIAFGRGRFTVQGIVAVNPLTENQVNLLAGSRVKMPSNAVEREQVCRAVAQLPDDRLRLRFLTPTQLTYEKRSLPQPNVTALMMRLLERLQSLELHYGNPVPHDLWKTRHHTLLAATQQVHVARDDTRWVRVQGGSTRANQMQDLGGFVGEILLVGELTILKQWLLWGTLVHIGKNAIKGNGWYEIDF